ncbi:MAG TPA: hypothetical protein VKK61_08010 [Tepidisphaeraceae bacterium]|nr:hypothetical protein [Tepidisphaeraceae bacterium]
MITREAVATTSAASARDLTLSSPPNWTAICFFAVLSGLHCAIAFPAFYHGRWEGYLSLIFALFFATAAIIAYFARYQMTILPQRRCIQIRQRIGPVKFRRFIAFDDVHAIRLTMHGSRESRIEILCDNEDIDCPPTTIPRQEALFLAILIGVRLIKVCDDSPSSGHRKL